MAYVFGSGFVCKDDAAAKKVAFNKDVMMNCVTLAGDLFNPSGTLTGGARAKGNSVLLRLNALVVRSHDLGFPGFPVFVFSFSPLRVRESFVLSLQPANALLLRSASPARPEWPIENPHAPFACELGESFQ